jgi:hypothetical protein
MKIKYSHSYQDILTFLVVRFFSQLKYLCNRFLKESGANKATMNTLGMALAFERERLNENNAPTDDKETKG